MLVVRAGYLGCVRPVAQIAQYLADPIGHFYAGRMFLHFFANPSLCGTVFWDRPDEHDIRALTRAIEVEAPGCSPVHASIVDARRLHGVDAAAFAVLVDYFRQRSPVLGPNVIRHALVRPAGVIGAVVSGFWHVAPAAHPERTQVFDDMLRALSWLGCDHGAQLLAELDDLQATISGTPRALQAVRDCVSADPRVRLSQVARAAGISARALQQQLHAAGTTFRREVNLGRVRAAQALLLTTESKLTTIAEEIGCASQQHFSTLFRRHTGESPGAWRVRHRSA